MPCEFSLELYATTDAKQGATYEITRFPSGTKGLKAREGDKTKAGLVVAGDGTINGSLCAACLPAGSLCHLERPNSSIEVAVFVKLDIGGPGTHVHRDGFVFSGGRDVTMQSDADLPIGTKLTVLVLGMANAKEDADLASPALPPEIPGAIESIAELIG